MIPAIYNEIDTYAADWLEGLITAGHIEPGTVDRRSIEDLKPDDVQAQQVHFFAGIGLWSYALRLAGWPANVPVWTGSCPCQPFSAAGKRRGTSDHRHLWPQWFRLIRESCPPWIFGEQVGGSAGLDWFDAVSADLEAAGYAVACADLPACSVGAPHRRQRLFFVAHSHRERCEKQRSAQPTQEEQSGLALASWSAPDWVECSDGKARPIKPGLRPLVDGYPGRVAQLRAIGNAIVPQVAAAFIRSALEAVCHRR